jgi:hypothetical protein
MLKPIMTAIVAAATFTCVVALPASAQAPAVDVRSAIDQLEQATGQPFQGVPDDWSNHHLVFSEPDPSSPDYDAIRRDPRYLLQLMRRNGAWGETAQSVSADARSPGPPARSQVRFQKDWTMLVGSPPATASTVINMFPAKYSFSTTTQSCSDFVVYSTQQGPTNGGTPSIAAVTSLYSGGGCGTTVPTVSWAYNTVAVNAVSIVNSVSLSLAGDQIAFPEGPNVVLLKLSSGSGLLSAAAAPTLVANSAYRMCTAPCMTALPLAAADNTSAPYVDYTNDALYVGDGVGNLYKFTGVFLGNPAVASGWTTGANNGVSITNVSLSSPVFDSTSGLVFVTDFAGGFLFSVKGTTPATQVKSGKISFNGFQNAPPLVDSTTEKVYCFASADASGGGSSGVFQFPATFAAGSTGTEVKVGTGATGNSTTPNVMFAASFDNTYFNTSGSSGNLYTCGNFGGNLNLYRIPITNNVMGTPVTGPTLVSAPNNYCSPITEFDNGTDLLFFSVTNNSSATNCGGPSAGTGCVLSFNINSGTTITPVASSNLGGSGGSTAMVIDNRVGGSGGEQAYFQPLNSTTCNGNGSVGSGTGVCATQASQAAFH